LATYYKRLQKVAIILSSMLPNQLALAATTVSLICLFVKGFTWLRSFNFSTELRIDKLVLGPAFAGGPELFSVPLAGGEIFLVPTFEGGAALTAPGATERSKR